MLLLLTPGLLMSRCRVDKLWTRLKLFVSMMGYQTTTQHASNTLTRVHLAKSWVKADCGWYGLRVCSWIVWKFLFSFHLFELPESSLFWWIELCFSSTMSTSHRLYDLTFVDWTEIWGWVTTRHYVSFILTGKALQRWLKLPLGHLLPLVAAWFLKLILAYRWGSTFGDHCVWCESILWYCQICEVRRVSSST